MEWKATTSSRKEWTKKRRGKSSDQHKYTSDMWFTCIKWNKKYGMLTECQYWTVIVERYEHTERHEIWYESPA